MTPAWARPCAIFVPAKKRGAMCIVIHERRATPPGPKIARSQRVTRRYIDAPAARLVHSPCYGTSARALSRPRARVTRLMRESIRGSLDSRARAASGGFSCCQGRARPATGPVDAAARRPGHPARRTAAQVFPSVAAGRSAPAAAGRRLDRLFAVLAAPGAADLVGPVLVIRVLGEFARNRTVAADHGATARHARRGFRTATVRPAIASAGRQLDIRHVWIA